MNAPFPRPVPDKGAMLAALQVMFEPDDVVELRALHKGKKRTDAGYFDGDHRQDLVDAAAKLNAAGAAVYVTLNSIDPRLLGRHCNRVQDYATATATDADVIGRRWLLVDFDPKRPKDTATTDDQLDAARLKARACFSELQAQGWPDPLAGVSGNGWHLLYPLDLPNDDESRDLVKGALAGLADLLNDGVVTVDQSVFNAGRITKLFGTVATKGDHTPLAPWRLSTLISTPARGAVVTPDQLRALHPVKVVLPRPSSPVGSPAILGSFDLDDFLVRMKVDFEHDSHGGRERYKLDQCPFNPDHGKGESAIFRSADGILGFKCQHSSCADKHWQDVRALVDGPKELRKGPLAGSSVPAGTGARPGPEAAAEGTAWSPAQPLTSKVEPKPYPLDALPDSVRAVVEEVRGFTKAPIAIVAASALAALSLAIQSHADVKRAEKLDGPVGLYLLTIADSGERKSTCDGLFTKAIRDYEQAQAVTAKPLIKDHKSALEAWEAKHSGIKDKIRQLAKEHKPTLAMETSLRDLEYHRPEPPRVPRLLYADATPEALAFGLARQWPSGGVVSAEGGIVFGSHGMGKESVMRNLTTLNQLWDGNSLTIDRRSSESFTVAGARLTVALQVQEPTLREFFTRSGALARGTGFLARFLLAWPESTQGFRPFTEAPATWPHLAAFNRRIAEILELPSPIDAEGALSPAVLSLAPDAKAAWVKYHDEIEGELARGGALYDVRDVASKSADNAARLAALFQVFEGAGGAVGLDSFNSASQIARWHLDEARRFFGELALPVGLVDATRLDAWLLAHCQRQSTDLVAKNHARQHGPLRSGSALDAAIRELADLDRVQLVTDGRRQVITVNPGLLIKHGAALTSVAVV